VSGAALPRRRAIVGTRVSITDYAEVLGAIDAALAANQRIYICCAPASSLIFARKDPALAAAYEDAGIVTPDGMGVVYAARALGEKIGDRVYGPDLMLLQLERAAAAGTPTFFYGGFDSAALETLLAEYRERFPGLVIAGAESPPHRQLSAEERARTLAAINHSGAQVVWVGLGSPKQELWMRDARQELTAPVLCGVGAAFDFHSGRVEQAPGWMQRSGLEWLHRLLQDPRRLGRRYMLTLPHFVAAVAVQAIRERRRAS
jgi:N-acetylglucosaminyldiphosphoundecaprenol N-acetyl-beta-D-mannosaminyltransferase